MMLSFIVDLTLATVVSLPINNNHSSSEGKRLAYQLCSLRENIIFKKLGVYGRRKSKKSPASNSVQKPASVIEPTPLPVSKPNPPSFSNDEVLPATSPDLPKPVDENIASNKPPAPISTNTR